MPHVPCAHVRTRAQHVNTINARINTRSARARARVTYSIRIPRSHMRLSACAYGRNGEAACEHWRMSVQVARTLLDLMRKSITNATFQLMGKIPAQRTHSRERAHTHTRTSFQIRAYSALARTHIMNMFAVHFSICTCARRTVSAYFETSICTRPAATSSHPQQQQQQQQQKTSVCVSMRVTGAFVRIHVARAHQQCTHTYIYMYMYIRISEKPRILHRM